MKILELRLTAFGPFTGRVLDLSSGNHGLHVIFGPNEAGKSSALRALHALLYGIPVQTPDAFLHPYGELRIGARLRLASGDEIDFTRRKANKGSLLGPDDTRLDDDSLDRFLGGVGPEQFRMFWGIDYTRLLQGGREILEGHGDLGESLFAAGSGASHLGALRKKLDEEAAALFVPRGQNRSVNQALDHLRELRSAQREATVLPSEWVRQDRAAQEADEQMIKFTKCIQDVSRERSLLERLKRVLPLIAERNDVRNRLADLGKVVLLAPDFSERRQDAETALRTAQQNLDRFTKDLREQKEVFAKLGATPLLVTEADAVNNLYKSLGSHRKALTDRPGLIAHCNEQRGLAKRLLGELRSDLDIEMAETLRLFLNRRTRIQKLAAERERLDERIKLTYTRQKAAEEQARALAREATSLPPTRNSERLAAAIEEARRRGDAETERGRLAQAVDRDTAKRDAAIAKLHLHATMSDKLDKLHVPTLASITRFERKAQELDDAARAAVSERQRLTKKMCELDAKIEALRVKKAVPTEEDLTGARALRDEAFSLLRDQWEEGRDVSVEALKLLGEGNLIDLYTPAVVAADEVADRLRREADRVAELAQYLEERESLGKDIEETDDASAKRQIAVGELNATWCEAWKPVLMLPPQIHDARTWHEDFGRLLDRSEAVTEARQQLDELDEWIEEQLKNLRVIVTTLERTALPASGLRMTLNAAEKLRQRIEKEEYNRAEHARKTLQTEQDICDAETEVLAAKKAIEEWQEKWDQATHGLLQGGDPPLPDDALAALDRVEKILAALDMAAGYEARVSGIDQDAESFLADVRSLARISHQPPEGGGFPGFRRFKAGCLP